LQISQFSNDIVHLSIAGGRKSMAVLMALLGPFYENIRGVYHILDTQEDTDHANFHPLDALLEAQKALVPLFGGACSARASTRSARN